MNTFFQPILINIVDYRPYTIGITRFWFAGVRILFSIIVFFFIVFIPFVCLFVFFFLKTTTTTV